MKSILFFTLLICFSMGQELNTFDQTKVKADNVFDELEGKGSTLTFVNIRDNSLEVVGIVEINGKEFPLKHGKLHLSESYLKEIGDQEVTIYFRSTSYIDTHFRVPIYLGNIYKELFYVVDRTQPDKVHIVLDWDNRARKYDLDSHLKTNSMHVYYLNKSETGADGERVTLSRDITRTNAYETITIDKPSKKDVYNYIVKRYRGRNDWVSKNVSVSLYMDNKLTKRYELNKGKSSDDDYWYVFKLSSYSHLEHVDRLVDSMDL